MKQQISILSILILLLLESCSTSGFVGVYVDKDYHNALWLNADSTFYYRFRDPYHTRYSEGAWQPKGKDSIQLQGKWTSKLIPLHVTESVAPQNTDSITLLISTAMPKEYASTYTEDEWYKSFSIGIVIDGELTVTKPAHLLRAVKVRYPQEFIQLMVCENPDTQVLPPLDTLYSEVYQKKWGR